ncbi:hypothetical protein LJ655_22280 [Paraburkholderia sp. MMS20-SJTN17]|uniref:Uncharacterized protein n=1 Tax=Paraburkholderia translucens TaxID=2886945 RepID=A0ABS8KJK3_9BURK|nr:hypothetical protein [Paraburkholderia sp. MMS20-SJTN17]MCC8404577.1 hypothetical protein [Paraburkholderia sp. MMS20-SJTN17]
MSETWMGLIIGGSALCIAMFVVIGLYRRERTRARMLRDLNDQLFRQDTPKPDIGRNRLN